MHESARCPQNRGEASPRLPTAEQGQLISRFNDATTNLGSKEPGIAFGGIAALQRILGPAAEDDDGSATREEPSPLPEAGPVACDSTGYADASGAANLRGAHLAAANLKKAELRYADPCGADLSNADLTGAFLDHADLAGANLSGAKLDGIDSYRARGFMPERRDRPCRPWIEEFHWR
ncbi:hypothetical protein DRB96_18250 [Streptomyces sp. ICC1]|nr:hypothetical protein DRB89_36850 [Streptomyces sp. ICC4]AWZ18048.1 hypothetical protein DRB96_18250 [Streptomyces sp. ICC1]